VRWWRAMMCAPRRAVYMVFTAVGTVGWPSHDLRLTWLIVIADLKSIYVKKDVGCIPLRSLV
jgi:hypothetical protein